MKKLVIAVLALISAAVLFLAVKGNDVQEIRTEIKIAAPPAKVWSIITDIDAWSDWSPIINASQGASTVGSKLSITMVGKEKDQDGPQYAPVLIGLKEQSYFHWRAHMLSGFVFTNDKIIQLRESDTGTHLVHIETFKGLLAPLMSDSIEKNVPSMLDSMNRALKELAEK